MSLKRQLLLFWMAAASFSMAVGMHDAVFNNFLADTFKLSASARGWLELPREAPGFLAVAMTGLLCMLPITRVGVVGAVVLALGMLGMALLSQTYAMMIGAMFVASCGMHLLMPVGSSLSLGLSEPGRRGWRMAQTGFVETLGGVTGAGLVWLFFDRHVSDYRSVFLCVGAMAIVGGCAYAFLRVPSLHSRRNPIVLKRKFTLYYLLESVFGARKQIFLTFGPWVLIEAYGFQASRIAGLLAIAAVLSFAFKPLIGAAVDRLGERVVLMADGAVLIFVCLGYGYAMRIMPDIDHARLLACACYIADNLLFAVGMGRAVYASHIADSPQETASTLAMGVSINHIASMTIPIVAGTIWVHFGYERVFLAGAILAVASIALSSLIPHRGRPKAV